MLAKLIPQQKNFFPLFRQAAETMVKAASEFAEMVKHLDQAPMYANAIDSYEREADQVALLTYQLLHKTFITPFDRNDINMLTTQLDDILDRMHRVAQRIVIYQLTNVPTELVTMADLNVSVAKIVKTLIEQLDSLKNQNIILEGSLKINQLENDAEAILLQGIGSLFTNETDFKRLLQLKEIYEQTKGVINSCQDTANLVKSIMLEYA